MIMADLGFRTINEMVGRVDARTFSQQLNIGKPKASTSPRFWRPRSNPTIA